MHYAGLVVENNQSYKLHRTPDSFTRHIQLNTNSVCNNMENYLLNLYLCLKDTKPSVLTSKQPKPIFDSFTLHNNFSFYSRKSSSLPGERGNLDGHDTGEDSGQVATPVEFQRSDRRR